MPDQYYPEPETEDAPQSKDEAPATETALLPKSILAGKEFNVGDEVVLKIVHMYEDEVEVEYAKGEEKEPEHKSSMDESMADMGKMVGES